MNDENASVLAKDRAVDIPASVAACQPCPVSAVQIASDGVSSVNDTLELDKSRCDDTARPLNLDPASSVRVSSPHQTESQLNSHSGTSLDQDTPLSEPPDVTGRSVFLDLDSTTAMDSGAGVPMTGVTHSGVQCSEPGSSTAAGLAASKEDNLLPACTSPFTHESDSFANAVFGCTVHQADLSLTEKIDTAGAVHLISALDGSPSTSEQTECSTHISWGSEAAVSREDEEEYLKKLFSALDDMEPMEPARKELPLNETWATHSHEAYMMSNPTPNQCTLFAVQESKTIVSAATDAAASSGQPPAAFPPTTSPAIVSCAHSSAMLASTQHEVILPPTQPLPSTQPLSRLSPIQQSIALPSTQTPVTPQGYESRTYHMLQNTSYVLLTSFGVGTDTLNDILEESEETVVNAMETGGNCTVFSKCHFQDTDVCDMSKMSTATDGDSDSATHWEDLEPSLPPAVAGLFSLSDAGFPNDLFCLDTGAKCSRPPVTPDPIWMSTQSQSREAFDDAWRGQLSGDETRTAWTETGSNLHNLNTLEDVENVLRMHAFPILEKDKQPFDNGTADIYAQSLADTLAIKCHPKEPEGDKTCSSYDDGYGNGSELEGDKNMDNRKEKKLDSALDVGVTGSPAKYKLSPFHTVF